MTSLIPCLPKHVLLMYRCHVGDNGKQLTRSYVGNHRRPGGDRGWGGGVKYPLNILKCVWTENGSPTHESFYSEVELVRERVGVKKKLIQVPAVFDDITV